MTKPTLAEQVRAAAQELVSHGITLEQEGFQRALSAQLSGRHGAAGLHMADLALAWACSQGDTRAIVHFESVYFAHATRALRKMRLIQPLRDDVVEA